MEDKRLLRIARKEGFGSIEDYVKANLHYLPKQKQELFCNITGYNLPDPCGKDEKKYLEVSYHGKN